MLILGHKDDKMYLLSSEHVPDDVAQNIRKSMSEFSNVGDKINFLKSNYSSVYNNALRIISKESVTIIHEYQ